MEQQTTYNANSIAVLEGLEAVRKRPGMYIGSVSTRGLNHLIYEIVDNAVDEHLAGYCSNIQVILDEDGTATIQDNGRGIPTGINSKTGIPAVEMVFTMLHAGGKFGTGGYKISGGLHGVGASVVNALSVWLEVKVRSEGKVYQQMYEKGKAVAPLEVIGTCRKGDTGTTVTFLPDGEIFDKTYFKAESIKSRLHETAYLNPGLSITFENRRPGEEETVLFHEEEGLKAYVRDLNKGKPAVGEIVYFKKKVDDIEVEAAFQYVDEFQETIMGFCNNICTMEGGTHITGFKTNRAMAPPMLPQPKNPMVFSIRMFHDDAAQYTEQSADAGEHRRLGQELEQNSAFSCSDRLFQADLACTFRYRYQHNIHNTDTADQKRNARDPDQLLVRALA